MKFTTMLIEQLDRVAVELAVDHPLNSRMALILVDNALELMAHQRSQSILDANILSGEHGFDEAMRKSVAAGFEGTLRFLLELRIITEPQMGFLKAFHAYRNHLYHEGLDADDILRSLAAEGFRLACYLMMDLAEPPHMSWRDIEHLSFLREKFPGLDLTRDRSGHILDPERVSEFLLSRLPGDLPNLQAKLSAHLDGLIAEAEKNWSVIMDGPHVNQDQNLQLQKVQLDTAFMDALVKVTREKEAKAAKDEGRRLRDINVRELELCRGMDIPPEVRERALPGWTPKYKVIPFPGWQRRSAKLANGVDPLSTTHNFVTLRDEIRAFELVIHEPLMWTYGWQQQRENEMMDAR